MFLQRKDFVVVLQQLLANQPDNVCSVCYDLKYSTFNFTITAAIHARSLANFNCQYADRHMNLKFMRRVSEREPAIRQFVIVKNSSLRIHSAIASWIHSYFDNVMSKFMINNRTHAKKLTSIC